MLIKILISPVLITLRLVVIGYCLLIILILIMLEVDKRIHDNDIKRQIILKNKIPFFDWNDDKDLFLNYLKVIYKLELKILNFEK